MEVEGGRQIVVMSLGLETEMLAKLVYVLEVFLVFVVDFHFHLVYEENCPANLAVDR